MTFERDHHTDSRDAREETRTQMADPRDHEPADKPPRPHATPIPSLDALDDRRVDVAFGARTYALRRNDVRVLRTVGTFRAVYADDLREDHLRLDRDIRTLREQGLLVVTHIQRPDTRETVSVLTLTPIGRDLVQAAERGAQRYHSGLVRPREVHHDAQLWRIYRREVHQLAARGATVEQVRLDHELKRALWSRTQPLDSTEDPAAELGLPRDAEGHVQIPDMQLVVREARGTISRSNVELVTRHYSSASVRAKSAAGFTLYDDAAVHSPIEDPDRASRLFDF